MGKSQKAGAKRRRAKLLEELGNKCKWCGVTENLELDCIIPQGGNHHRLDTARRITFYYRQHALKNVQILCRKDNNEKSILDAEYLAALDRMKEEAKQRKQDLDAVPF